MPLNLTFFNSTSNLIILGKTSKAQRPRKPKQLEDEFEGPINDVPEDDDYVDPFNVDDGLLQDENVVEDFPEEDEENVDDRNVNNANVPQIPEDDVNEDEEDDDDYIEPESEEVPEDDEDDLDSEEARPDGEDVDDAETVDGDGTNTRRVPTFFHCIMGGYGPFGPIRSIGHFGFNAFVPVIGRVQPRVPKLIASIPSSFPLGLQGTYTTMVCDIMMRYILIVFIWWILLNVLCLIF